MSDIVERLHDARNWLNNGDCCGQKDSDDTCVAPACIFGESLKELYGAADEIERLREALGLILNANSLNYAQEIAAKALEEEK
jgi:hypothetical protein